MPCARRRAQSHARHLILVRDRRTVEMSNQELEIVGDVIGRGDRFEEAVGNGIYLHAWYDGRADAHRLDASETTEGPSAPVVRTLPCKVAGVRADMAEVHNVDTVPV